MSDTTIQMTAEAWRVAAKRAREWPRDAKCADATLEISLPFGVMPGDSFCLEKG